MPSIYDNHILKMEQNVFVFFFFFYIENRYKGISTLVLDLEIN